MSLGSAVRVGKEAGSECLWFFYDCIPSSDQAELWRGQWTQPPVQGSVPQWTLLS